MNRRQFLTLGLKSAAAVGLGGAVGASLFYNAPCRVNRQTIPIAGLPREFDGYTIAHLSDFHHSPWVGQSFLRSVVALTNHLQPDLVALTGDYIHRGREWVPGVMRELASLRAKDGVVAVLGNHDYYDRAQASIRMGLRMARITDLTNTGILIERHGAALPVSGIGDSLKEQQYPAVALAKARRRASAILLTHQPDYIETFRDERVGLALCGHTHGGQCVFPLIGAPIVPSAYGQKYVSGLCHGPVVPAFVTRGVGTAFPPFRFRCPAEVALLTLRSGHLPA